MQVSHVALRRAAQYACASAADASVHGARAGAEAHLQGGRTRGRGPLRRRRGWLRGARLPRLRRLHVGALRGLGRCATATTSTTTTLRTVPDRVLCVRRCRLGADAHAIEPGRRVLHHDGAAGRPHGPRCHQVHGGHDALRRGEGPARAHSVGGRCGGHLHQ